MRRVRKGNSDRSGSCNSNSNHRHSSFNANSSSIKTDVTTLVTIIIRLSDIFTYITISIEITVHIIW